MNLKLRYDNFPAILCLGLHKDLFVSDCSCCKNKYFDMINYMASSITLVADTLKLDLANYFLIIHELRLNFLSCMIWIVRNDIMFFYLYFIYVQ